MVSLTEDLKLLSPALLLMLYHWKPREESKRRTKGCPVCKNSKPLTCGEHIYQQCQAFIAVVLKSRNSMAALELLIRSAFRPSQAGKKTYRFEHAHLLRPIDHLGSVFETPRRRYGL